MDTAVRYIGISGGSLPVEQFDLGHDVWMRRTYAHFMSPCMMAFTPAQEGKSYPAPWRAAKGGFSFDISIELSIAQNHRLGSFGPMETATWIVALMRLGFAPYLAAPVTIDMPFSEAARSALEPSISPFEIQDRNIFRSDERSEEISINELNWLKATWYSATKLTDAHPQLLTAILACDSCRGRASVSQSMLTVWGALEQLFAPSSGELRHRVAANIAAYLEPRGPQRLATYKRVMKLYNSRSAAAHTTKEVDRGVMIESWVFLRNALIKMISEDQVPSQSDFEHLLFADVSPVPADAVSWGGHPMTKAAPEDF